MNKAPYDITVLLSGSGSNLQAIIEAMQAGAPYRIQQVISNNPNAYGLQRAHQAAIDTACINHREFSSREDFDQALVDQIQQKPTNLIVLAGFMRKLTPIFIKAFNHIINIHPSLLPKYPGLNTHQRALDAGDKVHGVSIHVVTEELDAGPIIAQAECRIEDNDTAESLQHKVHKLEHALYPQVITDLANQHR